MMRILLVNKYFYRKGGAETYFFALAEGLKELGHEVAFFSMKHPNNEPSRWSKFFVSEKDYVGEISAFKKVQEASTLIYSFEAKRKFEALLEEFKPDIIHTNDWQTALVPVYYSTMYANREGYEGIKNIFTIHNIQYQGQYGKEILEDVFGIPNYESSLLEFNRDVNLMKGAIESANWVSTVSPTYAKEILDPWFAHKLDPILRERAWKLSGILNGIDVVGYDPTTDKNLYETYDAKHLEGKAVNKAKLQERLGLAVDPDVPLIGMVTRLVSHKGLDLVKGGVDNIMTYSNAQFVVLGSGDWEYEQFFKEMQAKYPGRFVLCQGFVPELARKIYGGSDIFLMPSKSEPCGLSQMVALRYGSIPVVRETGGLKDSITDSGDGKGNGFTFQTYDTQDMLNSVHRAIYAYNESKDGWKVLVERAMACDNSWGRSANDYIRLYKQLINS